MACSSILKGATLGHCTRIASKMILLIMLQSYSLVIRAKSPKEFIIHEIGTCARVRLGVAHPLLSLPPSSALGKYAPFLFLLGNFYVINILRVHIPMLVNSKTRWRCTTSGAHTLLLTSETVLKYTTD